MRWAGQSVRATDDGALPGLQTTDAIIRTVRSPAFAGIAFHEVRCRSALNHVPGGSRVPFRWTINPYRGCTHGCVYCFARKTHEYLDLDSGHDFDTQVVVKVNVAEVLRRELARPSWRHEPVALGTNTDPYQRAEGRYRLMPGIVEALAGSGTPLSILTKGTVLSRDLDLLADAARQVPVSVSVSLALLDPVLQSSLEPGTPSPQARLELVRRVRDAGLPCGVLLAPILPHLTDATAQLDALVARVAAAGATGITGIPLRMVPGAREWFTAWLARERPELVTAYERLYRGGANPTPSYAAALQTRLGQVLGRTTLERAPSPPFRWRAEDASGPEPSARLF